MSETHFPAALQCWTKFVTKELKDGLPLAVRSDGTPLLPVGAVGAMPQVDPGELVSQHGVQVNT
jgi:hypothetical protein